MEGTEREEMKFIIALSLSVITLISSTALGANEYRGMAKSEVNNLLMQFCQDGDLKEVKALLEVGANVNAANQYGFTPLFKAVGSGNLELVKLLVSKGAKVNVKEHYAGARGGTTPLFTAAYEGHIEIIKFLLANKADVYAQNNSGQTAIEYTKDHAIVSLLRGSMTAKGEGGITAKFIFDNAIFSKDRSQSGGTPAYKSGSITKRGFVIDGSGTRRDAYVAKLDMAMVGISYSNYYFFINDDNPEKRQSINCGDYYPCIKDKLRKFNFQE